MPDPRDFLPPLPPFPPWGGKFRGYPEDEAELARQLAPYVEEEGKAFEEYSGLADTAELMGRPDIAYQLTKISEDEQNHRVILGDIIREL